jgi:hypothetical protein
MRRFVLAASVVFLASCGGAQDQAETASEAAETPAGLTAADLAGTWTVNGMAENSDSVIVTYTLNATADPSGWTMVLPGRDPIALHVMSIAGDSAVTHAGPYESVLRPGVQVTTEGVLRLQDGALVGRTVAHYTTTGADSVVVIRMRGTRSQ